VYLFAEVRAIPGLKNAVIDAFYQSLRATRCDDWAANHDGYIKLAYENLPRNSKLLKFLVHAFATIASPQVWENEDRFPQAFLIDLLRHVLDEDVVMTSVRMYWTLDLSPYYEPIEEASTNNSKSS